MTICLAISQMTAMTSSKVVFPTTEQSTGPFNFQGPSAEPNRRKFNETYYNDTTQNDYELYLANYTIRNTAPYIEKSIYYNTRIYEPEMNSKRTEG